MISKVSTQNEEIEIVEDTMDEVVIAIDQVEFPCNGSFDL